MNTHLTFSDHAALRCAQRNLSEDEVLFIIEHGARSHQAGAIFFYLRRRDIPKERQRDQRIEKLIGSTVLVDQGQLEVITVYRNGNARKKDRRKNKYDARKAA